MGRKKKLDQLDIDSTNAIKVGMSYGKYMALYKPATTTYRGSTTVPEEVGIKHTCQGCGKVFYTQNRKARKFCCSSCRDAFYYKAKRMKEEKYPLEKVCQTCGKTFTADSYRSKYCCEFCSKVGHVKKVKEYQARRALKVTL